MPFPIAAIQVKDAFDRTRLIPTQDIWHVDGCACGLAAIATSRLGRPCGDSVKLVCRMLAITEGQGRSFIAGFDGDPWWAGSPGASKQAYNVGRRAAQLVGLRV